MIKYTFEGNNRRSLALEDMKEFNCSTDCINV